MAAPNFFCLRHILTRTAKRMQSCLVGSRLPSQPLISAKANISCHVGGLGSSPEWQQSQSGILTPTAVDELRTKFYESPQNILAQNACTVTDPLEVCTSRRVFSAINHTYQYKVDPEGKPTTNQKSTGRCWIFAALNNMRIPLMEKLQLDDFEFSQNYVYFWDKVERVNFWLHKIVETAKRGEARDSRIVAFLLQDPIQDGGQWDMFANVVRKYGLMPKKCFPETFCSQASARLNAILKSVLRSYAKDLRGMVEQKASDQEISNRIAEYVQASFKIIAICLGIPPATFTWEYVDKTKTYHRVGPISPLDFYNNIVKPIFNIEDKVCLVTDPRSSSPFGQAFTVDCLGNIVGGQDIIYNNQPVELLLKLAAESIKNKEAVWFGCEVSKRFASKAGVECLDVHDYELVFGVNPSLNMTKAERLEYGESSMTHAMLFTGVTYQDDQPIKFRVENSWGEDRGDKGYLQMTAAWFKEFLFEIVVDKKHLDQEVLDVFKKVPIVLPAWDPMGTLARV